MPTSKATCISTSNIAFVKYWGRINETERLPMNGSISMNVDTATTTTTVQFDPTLSQDEVQLKGKMLDGEQIARVSKHLNRIRVIAGMATRARVVSYNNFPMGAGIASSASAFAALTVAACVAADLNLNERELSILARQGSGSACRSIPAGFVEWHYGETSSTSFAEQIAPPHHWDIRDLIAITQTEHKTVSSAIGNALVNTSPFNATRVQLAQEAVKTIRHAILDRNWTAFGEETEREAIRLHMISMTSQPPVFYWSPTTLAIIQAVIQWRHEGLEVYYTIDAGANVHVLAQSQHALIVTEKLRAIPGVSEVIQNRVGQGSQLTQQHLF